MSRCDISLLRFFGWKMGLTSLRSSFPYARRVGTSKELHYARSCYTDTFVFIPLVCKQVCTKGTKNKKMSRCDISLLRFFGWKMGFEPTTFGTTIRHSNQLSYIHHIGSLSKTVAQR